MHIRDRIKELRRVKAADLVPNPRNWRSHPEKQRDALRGVLADVGYADALLARELEDGRLELIDGHLRAETTPEALVPVLVLDVDEAEAARILLTHDPLSALADTDEAKLRDLLESSEFENPQVIAMLKELEQEAEGAKQQWENLEDRPEVNIPESYQVVIECSSEEEQQAMYERMREEGYQCRVLTL